MLQSMGLPPGTAPERWNVEEPANIRALYRAYLDAGSQVILTNTFGASRIKLERAGGLGGRAEELNRAAAVLARQEAGGRAYVAGDIGPPPVSPEIQNRGVGVCPVPGDHLH